MKRPTHQQISLAGPTFRPRCIFVLCSLIYAILRRKKWCSCSDKCFEILGRCNLRINRQQRNYDNGRALPQIYRERILDLYHQGFSQRDISETTRVSVSYINKVVHNYEDNNTSLPPTKKNPTRNVFTQDVADYIESEKLCKPSIYTSEIQQRLLLDGVVTTSSFTFPKWNQKVCSR